MKYQKYYPIDVVNGEGTRCTLFVSGCEHKCRGCYNQSTWSFDSGHEYTSIIEDQIINDLLDNNIKRDGLSISGGDPLHPYNIDCIFKLVYKVKLICPEKTIWLWTGYELNSLNKEQQQILPFIDVLIDGKFIKEQYHPELLWRGSKNQIIHILNK